MTGFISIMTIADADGTWWERMLSGQLGFAIGVSLTVCAGWKFCVPKINRLIEAIELMARSMSAFIVGSLNHTDASKKEAEDIQRRLNETKGQ